ncbi:MAG TPA: glycosyltransferase [Ktedonobacterales bacterium]
MLRVAIVHDYLSQMGDAERVVLALHDMFPKAPVYTSIYTPRRLDSRFRSVDVRPSAMRRLPGITRHLQLYLPLFPHAFERLDLREHDLVISSGGAFAKGIVTRPDALHFCYCLSPTPWVWTYEDSVEHDQLGAVARRVLRPFIPWLRAWDYAAAARVDYFIASAPPVAARIAKYYRRESACIPPPVEMGQLAISAGHDDYFLIVSPLVAHQRLDRAVRAFTALGLPLRIIGAGRDERPLRRLAGKSVRFLGSLPEHEVRAQVARCRALIVPGEEDFSTVSVEAMAMGRPVIAFAAAGMLATVEDGVSGSFFHEPTAESLAEAVRAFQDDAFEPQAIRRHAEEFESRRFKQRVLQFIETRVAAHPILSKKVALEPSPLDSFSGLMPPALETHDDTPSR